MFRMLKNQKITAVSAFHYFRLLYRSVLFLLLLIWYIRVRMQ